MSGRYGKYGEIKRFERLRKNSRVLSRRQRIRRCVKDRTGVLKPFRGTFYHVPVKD